MKTAPYTESQVESMKQHVLSVLAAANRELHRKDLMRKLRERGAFGECGNYSLDPALQSLKETGAVRHAATQVNGGAVFYYRLA